MAHNYLKITVCVPPRPSPNKDTEGHCKVNSRSHSSYVFFDDESVADCARAANALAEKVVFARERHPELPVITHVWRSAPMFDLPEIVGQYLQVPRG